MTARFSVFTGHEYEPAPRRRGTCWCGVRKSDHLSPAEQVAYEREFLPLLLHRCQHVHPELGQCIWLRDHLGSDHRVLPPT